jgi:hypothetical protein
MRPNNLQEKNKMVETLKAEQVAAPSETRTSTQIKAPLAEVFSAHGFTEAQKRNAAFFSQTNELLAKASRAFLESQSELLRLEVEQMSKALSPPKPGENLAATLSGYYSQQHERTERLIAQMRQSSDLLRDYSWQFINIYSNGFKQSP